ncbi:hypothetical protein [Desulfosarcina variabilis]|uniref:hypothetical protein n=1 Tax=Desulfosarcina variabilis TaxID=2300 RepID=UPI003AFAD665
MWIFCYHNAIPQHSTLSHMIQEVAAFSDVPKELIEQVQSIDNALNLFDPNASFQMALTENQLQDMLIMSEKIRSIVATHIPLAA